VIFLSLGQILNVAEIQGKFGIMAKFEIVLQKELKSIGLNKRNIAKGPKNQKEVMIDLMKPLLAALALILSAEASAL